jgi:hypothetical protein
MISKELSPAAPCPLHRHGSTPWLGSTLSSFFGLAALRPDRTGIHVAGRIQVQRRPIVAWALCALASFGLPTSAATLCVDLNSTNPVPPYADWTTAATNIQDAIDAAGTGDTVLVKSE